MDSRTKEGGKKEEDMKRREEKSRMEWDGE